jgi:hypothetical protein
MTTHIKNKIYKTSAHTKSLLNYWLHSLEEGFKLEETSKIQNSYFIDILDSNLSSGTVPPSVYEKLHSLYNTKQTNNEYKETYSAVISPFHLVETRNKKKKFHPILIPAQVTNNGELLPIDEEPIIQRGFLEPSGEDEVPIIGSLSDAEKFFSKSTKPRIKKIHTLYQYTEDLFKSVTGTAFNEFNLDDYNTINEINIGPFEFNQGSISQLVYTLEDIITGRRKANLLGVVTQKKSIKRRLYKNSKYSLFTNSKKHVAQFSGQFSLSHSQRKSIHKVFETKDNEIIPVSGPPGTGKTLLLQNIVANYWTQAALNRDSTPPVMVACGATNQSVLNVIDAFGRQNDGVERWLPEIQSFGTFCTSFSKAEEAKAYQLEQLNGKGFSNSLENPTYLLKAQTYFLHHASQHFKKKLTLENSIKLISRELKLEYKNLSSCLNSELNISYKDFILQSIFPLSEDEEKIHFNQLKKFDCNIRHKMFSLATHYWEAKWLLSMESFTERKAKNRGLTLTKADWQRRGMLTPIFVSTISMICKFFGDKESRDSTPVDILFFDEAGQISPEKGAAPLSLSNKAIVIGDTKQLKPYTSIPELIDQSNLIKAKLLKTFNNKSYQELARQGICASSSNLMDLAIKSCGNDDGQTIGASLLEHRRSVPEIAQFCNALSYQNRLKPIRPQPKEILFPAFSYLHVKGNSTQVGPSRRNQDEARAIYSWIKANEAKISSFYNGLPISKLLACITPFTQQANLLKDLLTTEWPDLLIGTVQSIQGAERNLIIFSPTYDENFRGTYVFDRDSRMLNVAVSRAKDSFVIIGNTNVFRQNPDQDLPSALLGKFLFRKAENEIKLTEEEHEYSAEFEDRSQLDTLEGHQEYLRSCLIKAKDKVIIVSPGISAYALKFDNVDELVRSAVNRGVRVLVYTDDSIDLQDGILKEQARLGRDLLVQAGAELKVVESIHLKVATLDYHMEATGSFNWLSAVRTKGSKNQKVEVSNVSKGQIAKRNILNIENLMNRQGGFYW